ncbi:MAG: tRNA uridine-5-carboxymethylaminomethyl(34) synthesis enzyme MnmG [Planctomycetota bacterium]
MDADDTLQHPHPSPLGRAAYDVLVVGAGHAGTEAARAAVALGARTALVTLRDDRIGEMSCNPAIGGLGKGQLAREVDALGGWMGQAIDRTGIQFRLLNASKGFAVQAPRAQADRHLYREEITRRVRKLDGLELVVGAVEELLVDEGRVVGVRLGTGERLEAHAVILTTGTFLAAVMHTGESQSSGGRVDEGSVSGVSRTLRALALPLGRLKTGTPPRLSADSIDFEQLEAQGGDATPTRFSFVADAGAFPALEQVLCHVTYTNERAHAIIRENLHRAPMYAGRIAGVGPRYCPSIEDKVVRFAERERHQLFLEPEGLATDVVYVNGVSTSLPAEVQEEFLRTIDGLARARFLRHGYAVEYDFVEPRALAPTLAVAAVPGLFLAGQINGTSGYEEAAGQGLLAGANAALWATGRPPFVLGRHEAYLGVLVDDLVVSQPTEPYRMFSSRAEHRLRLRHDNADLRLVERGRAIGLVDDERWNVSEARRARLARARDVLARARVDGRPAAERLRRPEVTLDTLGVDFDELAPEDRVTLEADVKYAGYLARQDRAVERLERDGERALPAGFDFLAIQGLRREAAEKLTLLRPHTLGAAGRIAGVNPPDLALLAIHLDRRRRAGTPTER